MRLSGFGRDALGICTAAAMLAGCGGSQSPLVGAPGAMSAAGSASKQLRHSFARQPLKSGTEQVIYSFQGGQDGDGPSASLTDVNGTLYGTTSYGGSGKGDGTVFDVSTSGTEHVLHSFNNDPDGSGPFQGLVAVGDELYGMTRYGGTTCEEVQGGGCGTIFELSTSGKERILHRFKGDNKDGYQPYGGLLAVSGELYGATYAGGDGPEGEGEVFKIGQSGNGYAILYNFGQYGYGRPDGVLPEASLIEVNGALYGTTSESFYPSSSGSKRGFGTVFEVTLSGAESVVYGFKGGKNGETPQTALTDVNGTLYGTTRYGGDSCPFSGDGCGTVFAMNAYTGAEHTLYRFNGNGKDGWGPDSNLLYTGGALYGMTPYGGTSSRGTVFKITPSGKETVLYSFKGAPDGAVPQGGLIEMNGKLYGTTAIGGTTSNCDYGTGCGTVFEVTP